ncbi:uroporphyrinogen decarboxylase [Crocinitomix catalasitica]|nr:uroporphyrinogen decarboxylase [Crocinitomix catalasitica]
MQEEILGVAIAEWIGYLASAAVLSSFLMKKMRSLRIVNMLGCSIFIVYGFALNVSWPIVVTNVAIVLINLYFLTMVKAETKPN